MRKVNVTETGGGAVDVEVVDDAPAIPRATEDTLLKIDGVAGVGLAGTRCLHVYVTDDSVHQRLPRHLDAFELVPRTVGDVRFQ